MTCLKSFLNQDQGSMVTNRFIYSKFNYCQLVWHFCSQRLMNKSENMQKCSLWFLFNDYTSDYETLNKSKKSTMEVWLWRVLTLDIFCSINQLNPVYMQSLFEKKENSKRYKDNVKVPTWNLVTLGDKSVRVLGQHLQVCWKLSCKFTASWFQ